MAVRRRRTALGDEHRSESGRSRIRDDRRPRLWVSVLVSSLQSCDQVISACLCDSDLHMETPAIPRLQAVQNTRTGGRSLVPYRYDKVNEGVSVCGLWADVTLCRDAKRLSHASELGLTPGSCPLSQSDLCTLGHAAQ